MSAGGVGGKEGSLWLGYILGGDCRLMEERKVEMEDIKEKGRGEVRKGRKEGGIDKEDKMNKSRVIQLMKKGKKN